MKTLLALAALSAVLRLSASDTTCTFCSGLSDAARELALVFMPRSRRQHRVWQQLLLYQQLAGHSVRDHFWDIDDCSVLAWVRTRRLAALYV